MACAVCHYTGVISGYNDRHGDFEIECDYCDGEYASDEDRKRIIMEESAVIDSLKEDN